MAHLDFVENNANLQIFANVRPEGIYIPAGNHIINYFRQTANGVHATAAVTDLTVTK